MQDQLKQLQQWAKYGGLKIVESHVLPITKTIKWRTQRKWAHRVMWQRDRAHKWASKTVPCYDVMMGDGTIFVNAATMELLRNLEL